MKMLSDVALSNLYTMGAAAAVDPRQFIPSRGYVVPPPEVRILRARLIMEEALETCLALGVGVLLPVEAEGEWLLDFTSLRFVSREDSLEQLSLKSADLEGIIDGCCDTVYVAIGTLMACGVPDLPHLEHVNERNNAKFPGGSAIANENGKFLKPPGWQPPNHEEVRKRLPYEPNLMVISGELVRAECTVAPELLPPGMEAGASGLPIPGQITLGELETAKKVVRNLLQNARQHEQIHEARIMGASLNFLEGIQLQ